MYILAIGLMVSDIIVHPIDSSIFSKDSVFIEDIKYASGGDALNVAINLAKLGIDVKLCGMVGNDASGNFLLNQAQKYGVNINNVIKSEEYSTSTSIVLCETGGERHFAYYGKCNDNFTYTMVPDSLIKEADIIYVGSAMALNGIDGEGLTNLFKKAKSYGVKTAMDATWDKDGIWLDKIKDALPYTDLFFPSYQEAVHITGQDNISDMKEFMKQTGVNIFGVKLGKDGCYVTNFKDEHYFPAFECDSVVDTTGAGDSFMAGFLVGLLQSWNIYQCVVFASAVSNFCIRTLGATTNTVSFPQTEEYIKKHIKNWQI